MGSVFWNTGKKGTIASIMKTFLSLFVLAAVAHQSISAPSSSESKEFNSITCYVCESYESAHFQNYDPDCANDDYDGNMAMTEGEEHYNCFTEVGLDGRIRRGSVLNTYSNGYCWNTGLSTRCYCNKDICNNDLCQHCF